jgi:hypothetical protein
LVFSCSKKPESSIESYGVDIASENVFVDAVSLDSMSFASGKKQWLLKGLIVSDGIEYPYSMIYSEDPFVSESTPIVSIPPDCIDLDTDVQVLLTRKKENVMISWKTKGQFLCIKTFFTSRH